MLREAVKPTKPVGFFDDIRAYAPSAACGKALAPLLPEREFRQDRFMKALLPRMHLTSASPARRFGAALWRIYDDRLTSWTLATRPPDSASWLHATAGGAPPRHRRPRLYLAIFSVCLAAVCVPTYYYSLALNFRAMHAEVQRHMALQTVTLDHEFDKYGAISLTTAINQTLIDFLQTPDDDTKAEAVDLYLRQLNKLVGAVQIYVVLPSGKVVASSNRHEAGDFVGSDVSYRPYITDAAPNTVTSFYGIGTNSGQAGYYLSTAVQAGGHRLGVVVVKVDLSQIQDLWKNFNYPLLLSDKFGVVIMSSLPQWRYRTLAPLPLQTNVMFEETKRYSGHTLRPIDWKVEQKLQRNAQLIAVGSGPQRHLYYELPLPLRESEFTLTILNSVDLDYKRAFELTLLAALCLCCFTALAYGLVQQRLLILERQSASAALRAARDRLEIEVEQRSAELQHANAGLRREIAERTQAVAQMEEFQKELIRTENLRVIGQLSAGLAHEMNQPLAALSTLAANTVRFLDRGEFSTVRSNLERICGLVARMGTLTGQLRSFARRSTGDVSAVAIATAVNNAIDLLRHRVQQERIDLGITPPADALQVACEGVRLEQVLVNLIVNAIDSTADCAQRRVRITWQRQGESACICVTDNGVGLTAEVKQHLFEPFFTTKSTSGLGLGLAISADIINGFGGTLTATDNPEGGAVFMIELPLTGEKGALP